MSDQTLRNLAAETKAMVLIREYLSGNMHPAQLGELIEEMLAEPGERAELLQGFAANLRQQEVDEDTIESLLQMWSPAHESRPPVPAAPLTNLIPLGQSSVSKGVGTPDGGSSGVAPPSAGPPAASPPGDRPAVKPPHSSSVTATREVKSPFKVPYREFKFGQTQKISREKPPTAAQQAGPAVTVPRDLPRRVLLADDDRRVRLIYKMKFEEAGFEAVEAVDGLEAWKSLEGGALGAVVLDMKLPGMHGLEILARMTDQARFLPVVICSAHDHLQSDPVVKGYPLLRYLVKPCPPEQIVGAVEELLATARQGV